MKIKIVSILIIAIFCISLVACSAVKAESPSTPTPTPTSTSIVNPDLETIAKAFRLAGVTGQLIGYDKINVGYIVQWTDGKSLYQCTYADGTLTGVVKLKDLPTETPTPTP